VVEEVKRHPFYRLYRIWEVSFGLLPFVVLRVLVHLSLSSFCASRGWWALAGIYATASALVIYLYTLYRGR
jgi:hypothetical protein